MRIAVDTNILIGALTRPHGTGARILRAWREGRLELAASEATLREAELVLGGGWLARLSSRADVQALLDGLRRECVMVDAPRIPGLRLKDAGDARLVEAAVAAEARYLVTADREVLLMRGYGPTEFVTPAELARRMDAGGW